MTGSLINTIKEIILNFQERQLDTGVPRKLEVTSVPNKATICIGVRRSGKSTYMYQIIEKLRRAKVSPSNILYVNFFDDRLHSIREEGLGTILEAYYSLFPEKKTQEKIYCFFDEIQSVPNWEPFVDRVMRTENCDVYITGSSAQMLSKEIATQMRGRALTWEMFPFSFTEFLDYKSIPYGPNLSTQKRLLIQKAFDEYWETGGFPEVFGLERHLRIKTHQEYFHTLLYRDLVERHNVSQPKAVTDLAHWLMDNAASLYSVNKLTGYLKSIGHRISKGSVANYLDWLKDAFFMFTVEIYDPSLSRAKTNPKKIYCVDHALVSSVSTGILVNSGHLLENLVFSALRHKTPKVFYYKTKTGKEVDFIAHTQGRQKLLVQVCETMANENTQQREIQALTDAMVEQNITEGTIVTRSEENKIVNDAGTISVVPIWRYLLELENLNE